MQRKYFVAFGVMDKENLRCNPGFHSSMIFLYADCDDEENIKLPLRIFDCYSFYSHLLPYEKTFYEEPLAFFSQKLNLNFRVRGSYGEWRQEKIHDLCYGRGLTGRIIEMNVAQIKQLAKDIKKELLNQEKFLSTADNLIDREENYKNYARTVFLKLVREGVKPEVAEERTKDLKPLVPFNTFPSWGGASTCKTAILDKIANCHDRRTPEGKAILDYIYYLRYGSLPDNAFFIFPRFLTSFIPRFTPGLEEFIFHCSSDKWEACGDINKYPYCDWQSVNEGEIFAITAGCWYVDVKGDTKPLFTPDSEITNIIKNLKVICRICEINITDAVFKAWHQEINQFLFNLASCTDDDQQESSAKDASEYLGKLVSSDEFKTIIDSRVPVNLQPLLAEVLEQYQTDVRRMALAKTA